MSEELDFIENALDDMVMREDIIWIAGLLEGEGAFSTSKQYTPFIILGMSDEDVIIKAKNILDPNNRYKISIYRQDSQHKTMYQFAIHGKYAIKWMRRILPYMGKRRTARINELLQWYDEKQAKKGKICKRGHDLTNPENFRMKGNYKCCKLCDQIISRKIYLAKKEA